MLWDYFGFSLRKDVWCWSWKDLSLYQWRDIVLAMIFLIIITFPDICEIHFLHFYYSNWFDSVDQILSFLQKTHHFWKISQFFRWIYIHLQFLFVKFFFFTFLPSIISSVSKTLVLSSVKSWSPILSEMRNILQSFVTRFIFAEAANESVL